MGQRLMLSTPPATTMSSMPDMILAAAMFTASRPEAQKRDRVTPAGLGPAGVEHGGAGDVGALLAHRRHAAQDDVIDQRGVLS
jgi:hypothetical protein